MRVRTAALLFGSFVGAGVGAAPIQAQDVWGAMGDASHWCMFNRSCNWASHFTIGYTAAQALHKAGLPRPVAAGASSLIWVAKEIRDHRKWGNVLGTADSNGDIVSGVLGAFLAYRMMAPHDDRVFIQPSPAADGALELGVTLH
ncbi:MAG: hypothetical protein OEO23_06485 [Gemmatimonadota bacterium]|nr:hypothetical protein [Gemmatimonadota bacterium]